METIKTIEERAKLASLGCYDDRHSSGLYAGYKAGATEQKAIDEKEIRRLNSIIEHTASVLGIGTKWFNEDERRDAILKLKQEIFDYLSD